MNDFRYSQTNRPLRVLVTGGSGFLGSHVADALSDAGHEVTIFDIKPSRYLRSDQKMVVGDIMDQSLLNDMVARQDIVYHYAGIADIDTCVLKPEDTAKYNIIGTINILEACRKSPIRRFVYASSLYVSGKSGYFYRTSKQACESFIEDYHELYGIPFTCLRYGTLYGERADERNSIFRILRQAITDGKIIYNGTGNEVRAFIHIKDAAQLSVKILDAEFENQIMVITGMEKISYNQLFQMINEIMGNNVIIEIMQSQNTIRYQTTPYGFSPKPCRTLFNNPAFAIGDGLISCIKDISDKLHSESGNNFRTILP